LECFLGIPSGKQRGSIAVEVGSSTDVVHLVIATNRVQCIQYEG
jgi:hypothetical protein